jgi:hypothetical protein
VQKAPRKGAFLPLFERVHRRLFSRLEMIVLAGSPDLLYYNDKHQIRNHKSQISTKDQISNFEN